MFLGIASLLLGAVTTKRYKYVGFTVWYNVPRATDLCSAYELNDASTRVHTAFCVGLVDFYCCESCGDKCPDYHPLFSDIMSAACSDPATKRRKLNCAPITCWTTHAQV